MMLVTFFVDVVAFVFTAGLGILSLLIGAGMFSIAALLRFLESSTGTALVTLFGALLLVMALHFAWRMIRNRATAARFSQEGEWGRIELSPYALREFISGILCHEIGIERFRVHLRHRDGGIAIAVRTTLSPHETVSEVGRRIQTTLANRVVERTGVEVKQVSVLVGSIRAQPETTSQEEIKGAHEVER
jgi:uncharacterized alkaline shock family protein YloU